MLRGDPASREFIPFWMFENRVRAGMNANVRDVIEPIKRLIAQRIGVEDRRLADPAVALDELAAVMPS